MSSKEMKVIEEVLECGTSLAEREHDGQDVTTREARKEETETEDVQSVESLRSLIASDVLADEGGSYTTFTSPFEDPSATLAEGKRYLKLPLVYCDQTASNRPVKSIEKYMEKVCLPLYGNTHTNTSITGSQSTAFVAEARQIVAEETNAKITGKASLDVVLFAGHGTTSAVELLIDCLGLKHACTSPSPDERPVVFVGPYEHHSNLVPWRETGCEIVMVPECPELRQVDIAELERLLQKPEYEKRMKIGTFTAASNVTGKVCNVDQIAATLHRHGALAFFDYATGAPYMSIDMNPVPSEQYPSASLVAKDAVFLSPHKMLGGIGTPGVLIVKKHLVSQSNAPSRSGGGTVFYVTNTHHRFLSNRIERYEGGTPNVAGIIRVGLTFLMKRKAEEKFALLQQQSESGATKQIPRSIEEFDFLTYDKVTSYLREHAPNLVLLGSEEGGRNLPIFSFLIRFGNRFLHYSYVCAILNDVFGIQSRGGCQCSGPYSQRLLGLTETTKHGEIPNKRNEEIEKALLHFKERAELLRPGYTRISLPFKGLHQEEVDYVMKALSWVSKHGWALMSQYRCNHRTGEWRHSSRQGRPLGRSERRWLGHYDFTSGNSGRLQGDNESVSSLELSSLLNDTLVNADNILQSAMDDHCSIAQALKMSDADAILGGGDDDKLESLRWYVYPKECALALSKGVCTPACVDTETIAGALKPVEPPRAVRPSRNGSSSDAVADRCSVPDDDTQERKRKPTSDYDDSVEKSGRLREFSLQSMGLICFRDGDHSGEASFEEIREGIDDGELSEHCEIFDIQSDAWVPFQSILSTTKKLKTELAEPVSRDNVSTELKGLPKKASRDSSTWGKGQATLQHGIGEDIGPEEHRAASETADTRRKRMRHVKPPAKMMRLCTQAMIQWDMLEDGDRLLLGLSGGKDSLSLLHCLLEFQRKLPIKFEIEVCTIDPMTPSFDPSPLIPYVESLGLKYHYIRDEIVSRAATAGKGGNMVSSLCAFCARMKRGNLYSCARKNKCNKLVLAQHLDDCAESFMMSVMHNGFLRTMKANYKINSGDISVIRPLVYCRESLMTDFAKKANLPVINENCPACFEEPKERARVKKMLSREETLYPNFYDNIRRALIPLMHDDSTAILRCYTEEAVRKSRKENKPKRDRVSSGGKEDELQKPVKGEQKSVTSLCEISEADLIMELARRKADQYRLAGAMKRLDDGGETEPIDPTGQICSLNGGTCTISCRDLME